MTGFDPAGDVVLGIKVDAGEVTRATESLRRMMQAGEQAGRLFAAARPTPSPAPAAMPPAAAREGAGEVGTQAVAKRAGERVADQTARAFTTALENALVRGKSLKDVARALVQDLSASLMKGVMDATVRPLMGSAVKGLLGTVLEGATGLFAFDRGGVMTPGGPLPLNAYARGGIADGPQLALFGEGRRPEAFVPLPDGRRIPVRMDGTAAPAAPAVTIHMTVNTPDAASFRRAEGQVGADIAARLQRAMRRNG